MQADLLYSYVERLMVEVNTSVLGMPPNVAVHPAEGRRAAPLPRIGCNGRLGRMLIAVPESNVRKLTQARLACVFGHGNALHEREPCSRNWMCRVRIREQGVSSCGFAIEDEYSGD